MEDVTTADAFRPGTDEGRRAFVVTPFTRLARAHAAAAVADAMVAASLAGSLFFAAPGGEARGPVFRYLLITMLPFALLSPLIGPLIDRLHGGHRIMVVLSAVLRGFAALLMAGSIDRGDLGFFLYALVLLVFQKAYAVARSALTPVLVPDDSELVRANSKLALLSGVASVVGVVPAGIIIQLFGARWALGAAVIVYLVAGGMALGIKAVRIADDAPDTAERIELRGATIFMAGSAMGLIRGSAGFLLFLIAFSLSDGGKPTFAMAVVGGAMAGAQQLGNVIAPRLRKMTIEENLLSGVLLGIVVTGLAALVLSEVIGGLLVGAAVGMAASVGKLAFDSILQRDAPDANRGRAFARFETRFQTMWVIGGAIPVGIAMSATTGYLLLLGIGLFASGGYALARLSYAHRTGAHQTIATARAAALDARLGEMSDGVKARLVAMPKAAFRHLRHAGGHDSGEFLVDDRETAEFPAIGFEERSVDEEPTRPIVVDADPTHPWTDEELEAEIENPYPWSPDDRTRTDG